jgi:hypothetical protein
LEIKPTVRVVEEAGHAVVVDGEMPSVSIRTACRKSTEKAL